MLDKERVFLRLVLVHQQSVAWLSPHKNQTIIYKSIFNIQIIKQIIVEYLLWLRRTG